MNESKIPWYDTKENLDDINMIFDAHQQLCGECGNRFHVSLAFLEGLVKMKTKRDDIDVESLSGLCKALNVPHFVDEKDNCYWGDAAIEKLSTMRDANPVIP